MPRKCYWHCSHDDWNSFHFFFFFHLSFFLVFMFILCHSIYSALFLYCSFYQYYWLVALHNWRTFKLLSITSEKWWKQLNSMNATFWCWITLAASKIQNGKKCFNRSQNSFISKRFHLDGHIWATLNALKKNISFTKRFEEREKTGSCGWCKTFTICFRLVGEFSISVAHRVLSILIILYFLRENKKKPTHKCKTNKRKRFLSSYTVQYDE